MGIPHRYRSLGGDGLQEGQVGFVKEIGLAMGDQKDAEDCLPHQQGRSDDGAHRICVAWQDQPALILGGVAYSTIGVGTFLICAGIAYASFLLALRLPGIQPAATA